MYVMTQHAQTKKHPFLRLLQYASQHRRNVALASIFSVLNKIVDLAPPALIGVAVDIVVEQENSLLARMGIEDVFTQLLVLGVITLIIWALESLFDYLNRLIWRGLAQTMEHQLRIDTYSHIQSLELAYFEDQSTGNLMSIINDDVNQLERFLDIGANSLIQVATTVIVIGGAFFLLAPSVAWMAVIPIPVIIYGSMWFQKQIGPRYSAVREQVGVLNSQLSNNLSGITTIKSFTAEEHEVARIEKASQAYEHHNRRAIVLSAAFTPIIRMAIVAGFLAIMIFGGDLVLKGSLAVAAYSTMVFMTQRLLWPLTTLGETFDLYQRAMASTARIMDLLDVQTTIVDGPEQLPTKQVKGSVSFDDVDFAYSNGKQVIKGLSFDIEAGETAAIVGSTGAGKSTIIKLLLRLYDVTSGKITLDGYDLRELNIEDLRKAIGLVSQDVFLFHGTVRENIAYGSFGASDEDIIAAAQIAEAHDFILSLPEGYDTVVGERGQKLSGGQRQRISIARAILKNPPVLVLDEATSSVDNETEAAIQRSLERIIVGRTTIVIAHRLSTIRHADVIFVLENGNLIERGRHEELLTQQGLYAALWRVQTGENPAMVNNPK
ncbi:ABC transporter ATP-binding protein [Phototrophicus methaneseepsis]|uniref:ABC transporter ATP-binding protein n=2 Tax=Phototrophicus methaneseepsis TaxID=2710758 RepID=A0A7S8EDY8_9CHLR|nr:ABC transporter ATP-binding protein [Phototrophicus methaneseepsis]